MIFFQVLQHSGHNLSISQMPVILLPIHFDRDQALRIPSCQRSVVLRPFITQDFMTGVPAIPGKHLPTDVNEVFLIFRRSVNVFVYFYRWSIAWSPRYSRYLEYHECYTIWHQSHLVQQNGNDNWMSIFGALYAQTQCTIYCCVLLSKQK